MNVDFAYNDTSEEDDIRLYQPSYNTGHSIKVSLAGTLVALSLLTGVCFNTPNSNVNFDTTSRVEYVIESDSISLKLERSSNSISIHSEYEEAKNVIRMFSALSQGWNGDNAVVPSNSVICNALSFVSLLDHYRYPVPDVEDIMATPYGSIVLDFFTQRGLVSVEIGSSKIGFFTDFEDGHNYGSEGIESDFTVIPQSLEVLLA